MEPITLYTLIPYYLAALCYLLTSYFIGFVIRRWGFKIKGPISAYSILTNILLGWVSLVTIYSIVITKGKTVNILFVILLGLYIIFRKKSLQDENSLKQVPPKTIKTWRYLLLISIISFLIFLFQTDKIMDWNVGMFQELYGDFCYNIKLTQFLNLGFENRFLGYNFFKEISLMPYHYFEMWTTAMIYKILGLTAGICHMVTTPIICVTLMALCFVATWERNKKFNLWGIFCLIGCFFMMDLIPILSQIHPRLTVQGTYILGLPRAMPSILAILFCFLLYLYRQRYEAYYVLLSIPILSLVPSVAVLGTLGLLLLINIIKDKRINWIACLPYAIFSLLFTLYVATSQGDQMGGESFHLGLLRLYVTQPIIYFLAYLHCLLILWLIAKEQTKKIFFKLSIPILLLFSVTETFSIFLRGYNYDASQFTSGSIPYFFFALYTISFLSIVSSITLSRHQFILVFCYICINIGLGVHIYAKPYPVNGSNRISYIQNVLKKIPKQKEYKIGVYVGETQQADNMVCGVVDAIAYPDFLDTYLNGVWHYAINKGCWEIRSDWDQTPFRDYYKQKKSSDMSDDEIRMNFIIDTNIEYIKIYKSAKPSDWFLSNLTLLAEDKNSGEGFYKVNKF